MNLMVVDNQALFREGLILLLKGVWNDLTAAEAGTLEEALRIADGGQTFDVVLIEPLLPGLTGGEAIRVLSGRLPETPIIVVSAPAPAHQVRDAIEQGARGYIPKDTSRPVLANALRLVLEGGVYVPPSVLYGDPGSDPPGGRANDFAGEPAFRHLTPRQRQVLELLAQGKSNKHISRALGMAEGTVRIHVTAILKAFGASNRTEAAITAERLLRREPAADLGATGHG
ncbi:MAG: LuxR C-terminal-related transcriptional regulator [Kiloniellales bacterium]